MENESKLICGICLKTFSSVSTKNRHLKMQHLQKVEERKSQHIKCPICPRSSKEPFANYDVFKDHLIKVHSVSIRECKLKFRNMEEFKAWRAEENKEVDYACARHIKRRNGEELLYYNCSRSDSQGFKSKCTKRTMKAGGSIKISGVCPSRICAKIFGDGEISVKYVETHVGHGQELRTKRLLKKKQDLIVEQLNVKAKEMKGLVEPVQFGKLKVKSLSGEKFYLISYDELCDEDCRKVYCNECEICIHRYICECPEYVVKSALYKHIHAVVLYERRGESVPGLVNTEKLKTNLEGHSYVQEPTTIKNEACEDQKEGNESISFERSKQIALAEWRNYAQNLNKESFQKLMGCLTTFKNNLEKETTNRGQNGKSWEIDVQGFY